MYSTVAVQYQVRLLLLLQLKLIEHSFILHLHETSPLLSRSPRLHFVCWVLSVSWLKRNPTPEDTSTKQRRIQTSPSRDPVQTRSLAQSDQHQTNKIVQKGIFFKNMKKMEAWTYSLSSHLSFLSVPYFYILILCWFVIIEVHWWVSGQRARYETVCMERFLRLKAKKMSSKFVRLKWEYFYCDNALK